MKAKRIQVKHRQKEEVNRKAIYWTSGILGVLVILMAVLLIVNR